jgi:predicted dehydrogenase
MKLALIGLKGHVGAVLTGGRLLGDVEIVAVAEDDPKLLASFLKKEPLLAKAQTYDQWRHLIEHTMPDVCCVADENGIRIEQLLPLVERDIHIVSEKPLVTTLADLERLRAAFAKSKSQLTMLLELRHNPKYARVREIIQRGDIGEVCQAATQKSYQWGERPAWYQSRARLGGTIPFIGIHSLVIFHWVTALDFSEITAFHGHIGHPEIGETEDHASVLAQLSNGASVTARIDYLRPAAAVGHGDERLRVVGTKGIVEVNEGDDAVSLVTDTTTERIPFGETENLFVEFAKFLQGGPPPRITADDCFYMTEVVLQARQAADEKKLITIATRRPARGSKL